MFGFESFSFILILCSANANIFDISVKNENLEVGTYAFEQKILEALEKLRALLKYGDPGKGIPPLEPLPIPFFDFDFILEESKLNGYVGPILGYNVSDFIVTNVKFEVLTFELEIAFRFPILVLDGNYKLVGNIFELPIRSEGTFLSNTTNLDLSILLHLGSNLEGSKIKEFDVSFTFENDDIIYNNTMNGEMNAHWDNKALQPVLYRIRDEYFPLLCNTLKLVGSDLIHDYTLQDILNFIIGIIDAEHSLKQYETIQNYLRSIKF